MSHTLDRPAVSSLALNTMAAGETGSAAYGNDTALRAGAAVTICLVAGMGYLAATAWLARKLKSVYPSGTASM